MTQRKVNIEWNRIKALYLKGVKPKEIAEKFGITAKQVSEKAKRDDWKRKKDKISNKIEATMEDELKEISELCTKGLKELLKDNLKPSEKIQAIRLGYDITLLNRVKQDKQAENKEDNFIEALQGEVEAIWDED